MKAGVMLLGLGAVVAIGGVAYAASTSGKVTLKKGGVYTWIDSRGFPAADVKAQYESLGFASVAIMQAEDGWALQAIWTGVPTVWDVPEGLSLPVHEGDV